MGVVAQYLPVVAGTRFALVGVADDVFLHRRAARHEAPLQAGGEARAAAALQPRLLDLLDHRLRRHLALQDALPPLVAAHVAVGLQAPGLVLPERGVADQILVGAHQSSASSISSMRSGVRFSW